MGIHNKQRGQEAAAIRFKAHNRHPVERRRAGKSTFTNLDKQVHNFLATNLNDLRIEVRNLYQELFLEFEERFFQILKEFMQETDSTVAESGQWLSEEFNSFGFHATNLFLAAANHELLINSGRVKPPVSKPPVRTYHKDGDFHVEVW